jgi:hypothetical protein
VPKEAAGDLSPAECHNDEGGQTHILKRRIVIYDIDSKIPNLALMKISSYYKNLGFEVILSKDFSYIKAHKYYASTVFYNQKSQERIDLLKNIYGKDIDIGGSGINLKKRLPPEIDTCFPDYQLYNHNKYALGFLTRGCDKKCPFCIVPIKEGMVKKETNSFSDFVPTDQKNVMLLDDNLLSFYDSEKLLSEIINKKYAVNFSQSLDISYLYDHNFNLLKQINSRNARFTKYMIYFSCNNRKTVDEFTKREALLKDFGKDSVTVIAMFGFNTRLSDDYQMLFMIKKLKLIPFFQEYLPIPGVPARVPNDFFDFDLNEVIRLKFRSNGQNWEKYLRWLNRHYFHTFGKYYLPLLEIIYRYNNKKAINRYLVNRNALTTDLYKIYN